jgi:hypothetical protein
MWTICRQAAEDGLEAEKMRGAMEDVICVFLRVRYYCWIMFRCKCGAVNEAGVR